MLGAHLSISGGLVNALAEAKALGFDCLQVFTANQRQWKTPPLTDEARNAWLTELKAMDWHRRRGPVHVVSHNSYLVNLASPERENRTRSIELQRTELERCEALGIRCCVAHPGAHLGPAPKAGVPHDLDAEPSKSELAGLQRIARALDQIHKELPGYRTITCLETTVGSGSNLGYAFHHLDFIRNEVNEPERVGFCVDTCHITAAGYDLSTDESADAVIAEMLRVLGRTNIRAFHMNDSVHPCGSRKDRHAGIGEGTCGRSCFRAVMNHAAFRAVPKVLETPKGTDERGVSLDLVNVRRLKRLIRTAPVADRGDRTALPSKRRP